MNRFQFTLQQSPWFILVCLLTGALYAFILYQKKSPWGMQLNWLLAVARFFVVSTICFLLILNPFVRQVKNTYEKPTVVFAIDNSESIRYNNSAQSLTKLTGELQKLANELKTNRIDVEIQDLTGATAPLKNINDIKFTHPHTNLSEMLTGIKNNYENRNIDKVVLVSDGIINRGLSPAYSNFNFQLYTVALGDTTPKKDIRMQSVLANKVAYLGNQFPLVAEVENNGFANRRVNVYLSQNGKVLEQQSLQFKEDGDIQTVTFYTQAKIKGLQHYVVSVDVLEGEFTPNNNSRDVYIEVIDGKEKILLVAASPHPDIKAIRSALENNENYSFDVHILGVNVLKPEKYDLVIFHQIPGINAGGEKLVEQFSNIPQWFILGSQSNLNLFNKVNKGAKVIGRFGRMDMVTPVYNKNFTRFTFERDKISKFDKLPPAAVPFAEYNLGSSSEVILFQRVGNVETNKPLLIVSQNENTKTAVLMGEGIWQWRLEEFSLNDSHESFDELINKIIQFLSAKEDKRRLRVYPINNEFYDFEKVVFETELYNEIYERVYDQKVNLSITDGSGKVRNYSFTPSEGSSRFEISGLPKGVYSYSASVAVKGKVEQAAGQFTVRDMQLEDLNHTADHNLLRQLATKTEGKFFYPGQLGELKKSLLADKKPDLIHSSEEISEMINLRWLFFFLLVLVAMEWLIRKRQGSY